MKVSLAATSLIETRVPRRIPWQMMMAKDDLDQVWPGLELSHHPHARAWNRTHARHRRSPRAERATLAEYTDRGV